MRYVAGVYQDKVNTFHKVFVVVVVVVVVVYFYCRVHIHLRFKHAVMRTYHNCLGQLQGFFYMHHSTDRIAHTTAFGKPVL